MPELSDAFQSALYRAQALPARPDNPTLLKLYAFYKQATEGDVAGTRPGFADVVGRAKWDAWNRLKGTAQDAARQQYIDLVDTLEAG